MQLTEPRSLSDARALIGSWFSMLLRPKRMPPTTPLHHAADFRGRNLANRIVVIGLFGLVVASHVGAFFVNDFDDASFYRASAYLARFADAPLLSQLDNHLASRAEE